MALLQSKDQQTQDSRRAGVTAAVKGRRESFSLAGKSVFDSVPTHTFNPDKNTTHKSIK